MNTTTPSPYPQSMQQLPELTSFNFESLTGESDVAIIGLDLTELEQYSGMPGFDQNRPNEAFIIYDQNTQPNYDTATGRLTVMPSDGTGGQRSYTRLYIPSEHVPVACTIDTNAGRTALKGVTTGPLAIGLGTGTIELNQVRTLGRPDILPRSDDDPESALRVTAGNLMVSNTTMTGPGLVDLSAGRKFGNITVSHSTIERLRIGSYRKLILANANNVSLVAHGQLPGSTPQDY